LKRKTIVQLLSLLLLVAMIVALDVVRQGRFQSEKNEIVVRFLYTSEKKGWIDAVAPEFPEWFENRNPGMKVRLVFEVQGTRSSMISILSGESKPVLWSPASSVFVPLFEWAWENKFHNIIFNESEVYSLVASPIIFGTWKSFIEKHNFTSWADLYRLADEEMRFAHTSAQESNSGFMSVLLEASIAANKTPSEITLEDLQDPKVQEWMKHVESSAVFYGTSTGFLAKQAVQMGPAGLNVIVVYENLIIETAKTGEAEAKWNDTLLAVYPKEGTLWSDHPVVLFSNASWVSEKEVYAAKEFVNFLLSRKIQLQAIPFGFRPGNETLKNDPEVLNELKEVFKPELGVQLNLTIPKFTPPTDGEVLDRLPDLWLKTRATSLEAEQNEYYQVGSRSAYLSAIPAFVLLVLLIKKRRRINNA